MNSRYDAIVIGARCAGAATAMLLARAGMKVLAVDRSPAGADTLSTHALMRAAVFQLHRWGVLPEIVSAGTPPIRATTFHYGDEAIEIAIKPKDGFDALYGPRRTVLDAVLVDAARASGAEVVHRVSADGLLRDDTGRVRGALLDRGGGRTVPVRADLVIGADGFRSNVARLSGSEAVLRGRHATSTIYGYFEGLEAKGFHWHYRPGVSVGVIPTNDGRTCVFAAMPQARFRAGIRGGVAALYGQVLLESSPTLAGDIAAARPVGNLRPFAGAPGLLRRAWGPGWALVGDAGFYRDPITAHGITDALRDAGLLARAVVSGTDRAMADFEARRDTIARGMLEISDRVASFDWDLEAAKVLHLDLSRLMNAELDLLRSSQGEATASVCPYHAATIDHLAVREESHTWASPHAPFRKGVRR